jgi:hypothetical protein
MTGIKLRRTTIGHESTFGRDGRPSGACCSVDVSAGYDRPEQQIDKGYRSESAALRALSTLEKSTTNSRFSEQGT